MSVVNTPVISVKNLSFSFDERGSLFSDSSFEILKGDYVGFLGRNGSGKTTLIRILLGLTQPTEGQVFLFGEPISEFTDWHKVGYVPQNVFRNDHAFPATVREIVESGHSEKSKKLCMLAKKHCLTTEDVLQKVGITHLETRRIGELSGGEQQKAFIARALISQPEILFLDEPTAGVDAQSEAAFHELLERLQSEGITIILISHDIEMVAEQTTRILCVEKGRIALYNREQFSVEEYEKNQDRLRHVHHNH